MILQLYISQYENFAILQIKFLFLLLTVNGVLSTLSDGPSPPIITPNKTDITIMPNRNLRLKCVATEPIHWRFHKAFYGDYETHNYYNRANKYAYESVLDLNSVDFTYVDYYCCVKNSSERNANIETMLNSEQAAQIYVFVEDRRHPLVRASVPILQGNQYEEILIPCKPTSKNFEIQLFKEGNERRQIESVFNPRDGFRMKLNSTADAGQYACHAKFDIAEKFDIYFTVDVNLHHVNQVASTNVLSEPTIISKTAEFGVKNGHLELNCTVETAWSNRLEMKWELPNENIAKKEGRIKIIPLVLRTFEKSPTLFEATEKLIVNHLDELKDAGLYQCAVNDSEHVRTAKFIVKRIFESQKPQINLTDVFYNVGDRVNVNCDIIGYPSSKVLWSFAPCEEVDFSVSCDESRRVTFNDKEVVTIQRTPITQRSTLKFRPTGMGVAICEANNTEGKTEARANVIVTDLNEDFTIWNENEMPIIAGDNVSVACGASAFKYTEMNWYKDNVLVTNAINIQVVTKNTPYSQRKDVHLHSIKKEANGQYFCHVKIINSDDSYVNKSWNLQVIEPTLPSIISSNIVSGQSPTFLLEDDVKLICKFSGIPRPKITWYKDNSVINPIANDSHVTLFDDNSILSIHLNAADEGKYFKCVAENRAGQTSHEMKLIIKNISKTNKAVVYGLIPVVMAAIVLAVICVVCAVSRFRR